VSRPPSAVILSGSLGLGHEMLVRSCGSVLAGAGWAVEGLDCMSLLGRRSGPAGQRLFTRTVKALPGAYDALHFAHLRTGSPLARALDTRASARLIPALRERFRQEPADLVLSVFATGASAVAKLRSSGAIDAPAVVLCTDVTLHRLWVQPGTDLFLATSPAAASSVLRYLPRADVAVVPPPVRPCFYDAPSKEKARAELGLPRDEPCVLVIDSGWAMGPLQARVAGLARAGIHVLAVAGRCREVERSFRALARQDEHVHPFGFVDDVPVLMAAADVVFALPGATTCGEARVVGRPMLLLDQMPGHGRENLLHELEQGNARACGPDPSDAVEAVLAMLDSQQSLGAPEKPERWERAFADSLSRVGVTLRLPPPAPPPAPPPPPPTTPPPPPAAILTAPIGPSGGRTPQQALVDAGQRTREP
jgi:processive 1,2-diacylglycerol beta-glucosyltransferase